MEEIPKGKSISWRPSVYGFLVKNNSILCIKSAWDGKYSLPGGAMELGEDPINSIKREFLEETGYNVVVTKKQPLYFKSTLFIGPISKNSFHGLILFYEVRLRSNIQKKSTELGKEVREICWKKISDVKLGEFSPFQREFLKLISS